MNVCICVGYATRKQCRNNNADGKIGKRNLYVKFMCYVRKMKLLGLQICIQNVCLCSLSPSLSLETTRFPQINVDLLPFFRPHVLVCCMFFLFDFKFSHFLHWQCQYRQTNRIETYILVMVCAWALTFQWFKSETDDVQFKQNTIFKVEITKQLIDHSPI